MSQRRSVLVMLAGVALVISACAGSSNGDSNTTDDGGDGSSAATSDDVASTDGLNATAANSAAADCPPVDGAAEQTLTFDAAPPMCLDPQASYAAVIATNKGEFTIQLDQDTAPVATNNFVFLARNQYFDDTVCHRIIPGFVVQCGDPTGTGTGGPGYTIIDEPPAEGEYEIGSIAMAKTAAPDSGGSQFFIITGQDGANLPPQYSLFGEVTDGLETTVISMEEAGTANGNPSEPIEIQSVVIVQS